MGVEIEIKLKVEDAPKLRKKLIESGGVHTSTARQIDGIFDFPDERLKRRGEVMRLRVFEPVWPDGERVAIVTFKGKNKGKGKLKSRTETQMETDDLGGAMETLREMGLGRKMEYLKLTEFYQLGKLKVTLDRFPHFADLGYFIELEGSKAEIEKGLKKLKLQKKNAVRETYPEIIAREQRRRKGN